MEAPLLANPQAWRTGHPVQCLGARGPLAGIQQEGLIEAD